MEVWSVEVPDEVSGTGSGETTVVGSGETTVVGSWETTVVGSGEKTAVGLGPTSGLMVDSDIGPERERRKRDTMTQP